MPSPPPGRPPFLNFLSLCSAVHGVPGMNMGCFCDHPYGALQCVEELGDPYLWSATTILVDAESRRRAWITLHDLCFSMCFCSSAEKGRAARNEKVRTQKERPSLPSKTAVENGNSVNEASGNSTLSTSSDSQRGPDEPSGHSPLQSPYQAACGSNCSKPADCQGSANGCTCKTHKETYVMGKGIVAFAASCIISLGGKREEDPPCPCNTTYVSHACCGTEDGMVWEDESLKLGELMDNEND